MHEENRRRAECLGERPLVRLPRRTSARSAPPLATSLALLALAALALLPPGGMTLCLGHDGHISMSVGSDSAAAFAREAEPAHCPCDGERSDAESPADLSIEPEAQIPFHAPCEDLPVEGPEAQALPRTVDGGDETGLAPIDLAGASISIGTALDLASLPVRREAPVAVCRSRHSLAVAPALSSRRIV